MIDGVPHTKRRPRAIRRAVARIKTPRSVRRQAHRYARLKFLEAKALSEEKAREKSKELYAPKEDGKEEPA